MCIRDRESGFHHGRGAAGYEVRLVRWHGGMVAGGESVECVGDGKVQRGGWDGSLSQGNEGVCERVEKGSRQSADSMRIFLGFFKLSKATTMSHRAHIPPPLLLTSHPLVWFRATP